jgi:predicted nucleic acid-binding protein
LGDARHEGAESADPTTPSLKVLVDTNVVLDVVLARRPWVDDSAALLDAISRGHASGFIASHAVTTVHYIAARANGREAAVTAVADLLDVCQVVPLSSVDFHRALAMGLTDFEDAVQAAAALRSGADYLVSRNPEDFKGAPVVIRSPAEVLPLISMPPLHDVR